MSPKKQHLEQLLKALEQLTIRECHESYHVPRLWQETAKGQHTVNPARYYHDIISRLVNSPELPFDNSGAPADEWSRSAIVYNLFPRLTTAFDHDNNNIISADPMASGFRETGTLLKSIALLPYIKQLGVNTLYLLPVTEPGHYGKKGALGSPYAIKNPFIIDPLLSEPVLGLRAEIELQAFVEAAHHLGMRVVLEYVFRTASVDSDWISTHPDWFYWLKGNSEENQQFGPPRFEHDTLTRIYEQVDKHEFDHLPAPSEEYRNQFSEAPLTTRLNPDGSMTGIAADGKECRIASAFSDWPPDDSQPPWTDVTYLKMHRDSSFNYMAYNTIRMYDAALDRPEVINNELWSSLESIIPFYQSTFSIDGAMIDMGHALPSALKAAIVEKARQQNSDFAFWDENFDPSSSVKEEGFNAVFGSLPFVIQDPIYIRGLLNFLNKTGSAIPFFATGENHNTPRLCHNHPRQETGRNRSRFIFALGIMLPALPFIHSGMELCEWHPVNLGLNFSDEDRRNFPSETLPLFSTGSYDWSRTNDLEPLNAFISKLLVIRRRYHDIISSGEKGSLIVPFVTGPEILAVMRKGEGHNLLFIGNSNPQEHSSGTMEFKNSHFTLTDLIGGQTLRVADHKLHLELQPGECLIVELTAE